MSLVRRILTYASGALLLTATLTAVPAPAVAALPTASPIRRNSGPRGRAVAAQLDQLRAVASTHDIDLVLVGLGSNNTQFTFGDVASERANRFIADAWTGWWELWAYINGPGRTPGRLPGAPCQPAGRHRASLPAGCAFSSSLGGLVSAVHAGRSAEFPRRRPGVPERAAGVRRRPAVRVRG